MYITFPSRVPTLLCMLLVCLLLCLQTGDKAQTESTSLRCACDVLPLCSLTKCWASVFFSPPNPCLPTHPSTPPPEIKYCCFQHIGYSFDRLATDANVSICFTLHSHRCPPPSQYFPLLCDNLLPDKNYFSMWQAPCRQVTPWNTTGGRKGHAGL